MGEEKEDIVARAWPNRAEEERRWFRWRMAGWVAFIGLLCFWGLMILTVLMPFMYDKVEVTQQGGEFKVVPKPEMRSFFFTHILPVGVVAVLILVATTFASIKIFP